MEALPKMPSLITVKLECGDQITSRNPPLHARSKYICPAQKGHGYNVAWISYTNHSAAGFVRDNPEFQEG